MIMTPADRFETFAVGQHAESAHRVTSTDVVLYAAVTGDLNPVHVDEPHAAASRFGGRIAHGMLSMGFVSALIARALPGPGAIYLSQSVRFLRPVRVGDVVVIPPGPEYPHQFINTSDAPMHYLSISTQETPEICYYPDSGKLGAFAPGHIDPTLDRYDLLHIVQGDVLVDIVRIEARGASQ
mgnify:CR=1 FL=1